MLKLPAQKMLQFFQGRSVAYNRVFDPKNQFTKTVLMDLAKFCRAHDTTSNPNDRLQAMLEGRRQVWLRIQENLNLTTEQIYDLHRVTEIKGE